MAMQPSRIGSPMSRSSSANSGLQNPSGSISISFLEVRQGTPCFVYRSTLAKSEERYVIPLVFALACLHL